MGCSTCTSTDNEVNSLGNIAEMSINEEVYLCWLDYNYIVFSIAKILTNFICVHR